MESKTIARNVIYKIDYDEMTKQEIVKEVADWFKQYENRSSYRCNETSFELILYNYDKTDLIFRLSHRPIMIKFIKKNESQRTMICTTAWAWLKNNAETEKYKIPEKEPVMNDYYITVWDLEKHVFRNIKFESILSWQIDAYKPVSENNLIKWFNVDDPNEGMKK